MTNDEPVCRRRRKESLIVSARDACTNPAQSIMQSSQAEVAGGNVGRLTFASSSCKKIRDSSRRLLHGWALVIRIFIKLHRLLLLFKPPNFVFRVQTAGHRRIANDFAI